MTSSSQSIPHCEVAPCGWWYWRKEGQKNVEGLTRVVCPSEWNDTLHRPGVPVVHFHCVMLIYRWGAS